MMVKKKISIAVLAAAIFIGLFSACATEAMKKEMDMHDNSMKTEMKADNQMDMKDDGMMKEINCNM